MLENTQFYWVDWKKWCYLCFIYRFSYAIFYGQRL